MSLYHIIILALIQGLSEFLPVSSSGHLVLAHHLLEGEGANLCWSENRTIDVAVHIGTLLSVLVYFRRDLLQMACGVCCRKGEGLHLFKMVLLASIPVIIGGYVIHMLQPSLLCLLQVMAWMTLIFGIVLWIADKYFPDTRKLDGMGWKDAALIGLAQVLALVPGTSRSGITMTAARFLGFSRVEAARFSLLLAIIAIGGAGTLAGLDLFQSGNARLGLDSLIAALLAFVSGWVAIALMMKWLEKSSFTVFAVYRIALGALLLVLIYADIL